MTDTRPTLTRHVIPRDIWVECEEGDDGASWRQEDGRVTACVIEGKTRPRRLVGTNMGRRHGLVFDTVGLEDVTMTYIGKGVLLRTGYGDAHYIPDADIVEYRDGDKVVARVVE